MTMFLGPRDFKLGDFICFSTQNFHMYYLVLSKPSIEGYQYCLSMHSKEIFYYDIKFSRIAKLISSVDDH